MADDLKDNKGFSGTGIGKFLHKMAGNIPEIAGDVITVATSPNPIGAVASLFKEKFLDKIETDERYKQAYEEFQIKKMEFEQELAGMQLQEKVTAHETYRVKNEMADYIAKRVTDWNLIIIFILLIVNIICLRYLQDTLLAVISNVIGGIMNQLFTERTTVMGFFFGNSVGKKTKELNSNE